MRLILLKEVEAVNNVLLRSSQKKESIRMTMNPVQNIEHDLRYFIRFGQLIGLYPPKNRVLSRLIGIVPLVLLVVTLIDWAGFFYQPSKKNPTAAQFSGRIGSPQFYTFGTFYYFYIQKNHHKLLNIFDKWNKIPIIVEDKHLGLFTNLSFGLIFFSAITENIVFHFKLFPVFEPPVQNKTSFEVYYERSHGFWPGFIPFTPYHACILVLTNKFALYSWNYVDLMVTILCRALTFHFKCLNESVDILGPTYAVQRHEDLIEILRLLEAYLSPIVFGSFYMDFYATCMQLHMWMTPSEHQHFLHTIYLLWAFVHLIVRMFLLSYHASSLHEAAGNVEALLHMDTKPCSNLVRKRISRVEISPKRKLAISGMGCFFVTKKFILTLIYVAFSFQIFLMQSDTLTGACT